MSNSKIDFYLELIDYFLNNDLLSFRGVVATNKSKLNHDKYNNGQYDIWYYKMYFALLNTMIDPFDEYKILIDIKDTNGGSKVRKLKNVLCNNIYDFKNEVVQDVVQINSKESEIIQLTDLLIGALSYYHRKISLEEGSSEGKIKIINYLYNKYNINLSKTTNRNENKFNIFIWNPREY